LGFDAVPDPCGELLPVHFEPDGTEGTKPIPSVPDNRRLSSHVIPARQERRASVISDWADWDSKGREFRMNNKG
jgi:hypothetical protein